MKKKTVPLSRQLLSLLLTAAMALSLCAPAAAGLESVHVLETEPVTQEVSAESSAAQTPAEEVPAEEVPAEEVPAEEVPAEEVPVEEETPISLESGALESASLESYSYSGGSGTSEDPYQISSLADLEALRDAATTEDFGAGKYYKQTEDITEAFTGDGIPYFAGTYDGGGHSIKLAISSNSSFVGLFQRAGSPNSEMTLKNLTLTGSVTGTATETKAVGALVGQAGNKANYPPTKRILVYNVSSSVNVTGQGNVGGLIGEGCQTRLFNSNSIGTVKGDIRQVNGEDTESHLGGIVGFYNWEVTVNICWFGGTLKGTAQYRNAIIGQLYGYGVYYPIVYCYSIDKPFGDDTTIMLDNASAKHEDGYGDGFVCSKIDTINYKNDAVLTEAEMQSVDLAMLLNEGRNAASKQDFGWGYGEGSVKIDDLYYWKVDREKNGGYPYLSPDAPTTPAVSVEGTSALGATLTAQVSGGTDKKTYQWQQSLLADAAYMDIAGANAATYQVTKEQVGQYVRCMVTDYGDYTGKGYSTPVRVLSDCVAPTDLTVTLDANDATSATLSFKMPSVTGILGYTVTWYLNGVKKGEPEKVDQTYTSGETVTKDLSGLTEAGEYTICVAANVEANVAGGIGTPAATTYTAQLVLQDPAVTHSAENPYLIRNLNELKLLRSQSIADGTDTFGKEKFYQLDDDFSNEGTPLTGSGLGSFAGTFDGNGKTIALELTESVSSTGTDLPIDYKYMGLFGGLAMTATVKNLLLTGTIASEDMIDCVGAVSGYLSLTLGSVEKDASFATVYNVGSTVNVNCPSARSCGGLAGIMHGTLLNSWCTGTVEGDDFVGGLAGRIPQYGLIKNCWYGGETLPEKNPECDEDGYTTGYVGYIAGIVVEHNGDDPGCSNCYASAPTEEKLIAAPYLDTVMQNCATKTIAEMKTPAFAQLLNDGRIAEPRGGGVAKEDLWYWRSENGKFPTLSSVALQTTTVSVTDAGTIDAGDTLTAAVSAAQASASYQWQSSYLPDSGFADIAGANAANYQVTTADTGKYIRVVASCTGDYTGVCSSTSKLVPTSVAAPTGLTMTPSENDVSAVKLSFKMPAAESIESYTVIWYLDGEQMGAKTVTGTFTSGQSITDSTSVSGLNILGGTYTIYVAVTTAAGNSQAVDASTTYTLNFNGGGQSADNPYLIRSLGELKLLRDASITDGTYNFGAGKFYKLTDSITEALTGKGLYYFAGTFDGAGYTIKLDLDGAVTRPNKVTDVGLFGNISTGATVKNLHLTGSVKYNGILYYNVHVGALAGSVYGGSSSNPIKVYNIFSEVDVTGYSGVSGDSGLDNCAGGLLGSTSGHTFLANSGSTGTVKGSDNIGGLCGGGNLFDNISNCWFGGTVTGAGAYTDVGAIVGYGYNNTYNTYALNNSIGSEINSDLTQLGFYGEGADSKVIHDCGLMSDLDMQSPALAVKLNSEANRTAVTTNTGIAATELWYWQTPSNGGWPILSQSQPTAVMTGVSLVQSGNAFSVTNTSGKSPYAYVWENSITQDGEYARIVNATTKQSSYTPVASDNGKYIRVRVWFDGANTSELTFTSTASVTVDTSTATITALMVAEGSAMNNGPYNAAGLTTISATVTAGSGRTADGAMYSLQNSDDKYYNGSEWITGETWLKVGGGTATKPSLDLSTILAATPDGSYTIWMYGAEVGCTGKPDEANIKTVTFTLDNTAPVIGNITITTEKNGQRNISTTTTTTDVSLSGTINVYVTDNGGLITANTANIHLKSSNAGDQGQVDSAEYNSGEGMFTIAYSGLKAQINDYKLVLDVGAFKDASGNLSAAAETKTFTTIDGKENGATFSVSSSDVTYNDTITLTVTLAANTSAITWQESSAYFELLDNADSVEGSKHSRRYKVISGSNVGQTIQVTQKKADDVNGFTHDFTITPKPIVIELGAGTVAQRAYNASYEVTVTPVITNLVEGDATKVILPTIKGTIADANVGTGKSVIVSEVDCLTLSGEKAQCYTLVGTVEPTTLTANITSREIDVSSVAITGVTATKVYDGTVNSATVTMTNATIATGVNSEKLTLTLREPTTVTYTDNANVGQQHAYQIPATSLQIANNGTAFASNYTLTAGKTASFSNGVITKKTITIAPTNTDPYTIVQNQAAVAIRSLTGIWTAPDAPTALTLDIDFTVTYSLTNGKDVASLSDNNTKISATGTATGITVTATIALNNTVAAGNYELSSNSKTKVLNINAINGVPIPFVVSDVQPKTYGDGSFSVVATIGAPADNALDKSGNHPMGYTFVSNNENIATVDSNGNVTIVGAGNTSITVTAKAKTGAEIVYAQAPVPYVDNPKTVTINVDKADLTDVLKTLSFTKEYDRSANFTNATPNNSTTITGVKSDTFTVSAANGAYQTSANADTANVADATKVQITGLSLAPVGSAALSNYKIGTKDAAATMSELNITTTAPSTISKKAISLSTSLTKAYDGNTNTTLDEVQTKEFNTAPVISGDTITITGVNGAYTSKDVHAAANSAITVTASGAENYTITWTVTDEVTHKSGVTVTAKTGDIKIEAAALTTALTSVDSYVNVTGLISGETVANNLYGALTWDDESKSYKSGDGNMSVAFYKLKAGVTSNGGTAGTWADFNKDAETPAENMGDVLELISGTTEPTAGTYYVLINATEAATDVGNYNVTGFADKNSALLASFNKLTVSNPPSGGGGSGSSSSASETETKTEVLPTAENDVKAEATVKGETASLKISTAELAKASEKLTLDLSTLDKPITAAALPVDTLAKLAGKVDAVTIALTETAVTLDAGVLDTVANAGSGDVTLSVTEYDKTPLDVGAQTIIGDRPVYELSLKVGEKDIHELGGKATVSLPYTPKAGEDHKFVVVWRIVDGVPQPLACQYDAATGKVIFESETFSLYVVAYFPFADVSTSSWYYAPTAYAYMTGLMNGMGDYQFQPDFKLSRPMLATMLYGMEGKPAVSMSNPFNDVADDAWYTTSVLWAAEQKLINGYYSNVFGANDAVTREQMALILYNYAKQKGYDVSDRVNLSAFKDTADISDWAQDAIRWAVANGLISGRDNGTLDPKGQISRAEVATIMYAFNQKFVH